MIKPVIKSLLGLVILFLPAVQGNATVVKMEVFFGGISTGNIFIEMFDTPSGNRTSAPVTVANFLSYIDDGNGNNRYDGTFIHRSKPGFIVQGGGFIYDPALGAFAPPSIPPLATDPVRDIVTPSDPMIVNEFDPSRSNLRGTIAMAKVGNNPDSATSQWFFNLADNSANLDNQNGGFTVFGQVMGKGMDIVDDLEALVTTNEGSPFTDLPVTNFTLGDPVTNANLVTINVAQVSEPLFINPSVLDFGLIQSTGTISRQTVTLTNTGLSDLTLGSVDNLNVLASPYSLEADNCSNQTLTSASTCSLIVAFDTQVTGEHQSTIDIPFNNGTPATANLVISGATAPLQTVNLPLTPGTTINLGDTRFDKTAPMLIELINQNPATLSFSGFNISGIDANQFSISRNDCSQLLENQTCRAFINFTPVGTGSRNATLEITTDDPVTPIIMLPLIATSSSDNDGISDTIEAAVANNGDGNNDGVSDSQQDNVASLPDSNGSYVTLVTEAGVQLTNILAFSNPSPVNSPTIGTGSITFPIGFFLYRLEGLQNGGSTTVTIHPSSPKQFNSHFFVTPPSIPIFPAQWRQFLYNGVIGAEFAGGDVIIHYVDGGPGDDDNLADGRVTKQGVGPSLITTSNTSSGGGCSITINPLESNRSRFDWWLVAIYIFLLGHYAGAYRKIHSSITGIF